MSSSQSDPRLVRGAAIAEFLNFTVSSPVVRVRGPAADAAAESIVLEHRLTGPDAVRLESCSMSLGELSGQLTIRAVGGRHSTSGLSREEDGFWINIVMSPAEFEQTLDLLAAQYHLVTVGLEFDVEYEQSFTGDGYWDDLRYPWVACRAYALDWMPQP